MIELSVKQIRDYAVPLIYECMGEYVGAVAEQAWSTDAARDETDLWGLFDQDQLIGICGLGSDVSAGKVWLGYFAVRAKYRGHGVGKQMLVDVENIARHRGYKWIYIETYDHPTFSDACRLYEKEGYVSAGELVEYLADGSDAVYYRKAL